MHPIVPLLQLVYALGHIGGRKRLQKMVHILQECGAGFPERFQYSFYGMYSLQLKTEIDLLKEEGLVQESPASTTGFTVTRTPELEALLEELELTSEPEWLPIARELDTLTPLVLEGISTILYLRHTENDDLTVRRQLLALKPHLSNVVDQCFSEADALLDSR